MPAEEVSQEVNHAKINAITRAMKRLGCDSLKTRSLHVKVLLPHAEQGLCMPRRYLCMRRTFAHTRSWLSACGECTSTYGAGPPHAEMGIAR